MRTGLGRVVAALPAIVLVGLGTFGLGACSEVEQAQQHVDQAQEGLDRASTCAKAIRLANYTPNFDNPADATAQAREKVAEAHRLAEQTADKNLAEHLRSVGTSLEKAANGSVAPQDVPRWIDGHLQRTERILRACQG